MHVKIGYWRRLPEGGKLKIQVFFHGNKLFWQSQAARFEDWMDYTPDEADWDQLEEDVSNRVRRGLMQQPFLDLVRKRGAR